MARGLVLKIVTGGRGRGGGGRKKVSASTDKMKIPWVGVQKKNGGGARGRGGRVQLRTEEEVVQVDSKENAGPDQTEKLPTRKRNGTIKKN